MFNTLMKAGVALRLSKDQFGPDRVKNLGYEISRKGIQVRGDRIQAMTDIKQPSMIRALHAFLGTVNFVRCVIKNYAEIVNPLTELTKREFADDKILSKYWKLEHTQASTTIKHLLSGAPISSFPNNQHMFMVHVDASDVGIGAFLAQRAPNQSELDENLAIVALLSKDLTASQRRYTQPPP